MNLECHPIQLCIWTFLAIVQQRLNYFHSLESSILFFQECLLTYKKIGRRNQSQSSFGSLKCLQTMNLKSLFLYTKRLVITRLHKNLVFLMVVIERHLFKTISQKQSCLLKELMNTLNILNNITLLKMRFLCLVTIFRTLKQKNRTEEWTK